MPVEFRLIYRGPLPAQGAGSGGSRIADKHSIRRQIHAQMRELWRGHSVLGHLVQGDKVLLQHIDPRSKFERFGYLFLPLITKARGIACSIEILFLRRDNPGNLVTSGGDIDNRVKVLFDALRIPHYEDEVKGFPPHENEYPFFCLLEDDTLITDVKITTDRLLMPLETDEHIHDVHLVVSCRTKIVDDQIASRWWA